MPLLETGHGELAGIRRLCAYLSRPLSGKSDCAVSETIRRSLPDRPESLSLERGGRHRRSPNKAAADFEEKWKAKGLSADMYSGPSWEGGIKPEKPAPPKPPATPKPAAPAGLCPTSQPPRITSTLPGPSDAFPASDGQITRSHAFSFTSRPQSAPVCETAGTQDDAVCFNAFADNRLWLKP